jgi:hypothetical protein
MTSVAFIFIVVNGIAILTLPRRWAALPMLAGALYMTLGQGVELGPFNFPVIRLLIAAGALRVLLRGELKGQKLHGIDTPLLIWAAWAIVSSLFHADYSQVLVNRLGLTYNALGIYFLLRCLCQSLADVVHLCRLTAVLLVPLSLAMLWEVSSGYNLFSVLGGVNEFSEVRNGVVRAQGPFAHSILAGSVGAVFLPMVIGLWGWHRNSSMFGGLACLAMVGASGSTGPIGSAVLGVCALCMWPWRDRMRVVRWAAVVAYVALDVLMRAPAYYLLARIDLAGGSTGWHRAALIEAALNYLPDWWLAGTDYTRHWLPYGVPWSPNHADITNYYIWMGIMGGLPLILLFIAVLVKGFSLIGRMLSATDKPGYTTAERFMIWALGASLFSHAATLVSVSYFDQSVLFFYLTLAAISSVAAPCVAQSTSSSAAPLAHREIYK